MTLNCPLYKGTLDKCRPNFDLIKAKYDDIRDVAHVISNSSGVHIIAVTRYLMRPEVYGPTLELQSSLTALEAWYKIEKIIDFKVEPIPT